MFMLLCVICLYSFAFNICPRVLSVGFLFVSLFLIQFLALVIIGGCVFALVALFCLSFFIFLLLFNFFKFLIPFKFFYFNNFIAFSFLSFFLSFYIFFFF